MIVKPYAVSAAALALAALLAAPVLAQSTRTTTQPAPASAASSRTTSPEPQPVATSGTDTVPRGIRPWNEQEYRLGPGDKLRVEVYGEPQLSQSLQVRPDGKITLTLVGDVMAAGRTALELREALTSDLKTYVNNPSVTVIVQDAIANQIDVAGEVESPGQQVLMGPVTILQAISRAGGLKEFAKQGDIYVLRPAPGGPQRIDAAYKDALKGKVAPMVLQPGDTVVVP